MAIDKANKRVLFVLAALLAGVPLFLVGSFANVDSIWFRLKADRAEVLILDMSARGTNFPWGAVYTYRYAANLPLDGKVYQIDATSDSRYEVGTWIQILYDPANPAHARVDDWSRELQLNGVSFVPGLILLIGAGIIMYRIKRGLYAEK